MAAACFNPFRFRKKEKPIPCPSSWKAPWKTKMEHMERKRFDSLESWSMILESENVETWEEGGSRGMDRRSFELFIGNKFASGAHKRIYRQRAVAVKMVRILTHKEVTRMMLEQQFKSEVALLSRLYHSNIVQGNKFLQKEDLPNHWTAASHPMFRNLPGLWNRWQDLSPPFTDPIFYGLLTGHQFLGGGEERKANRKRAVSRGGSGLRRMVGTTK